MPLPDLKVPETLGACADLLFDIRESRRKLEKEAEEWQKQETALTEHIIRTLPDSDGGAVGKHHQVHRQKRVKPRVTDWALFFKHVKRTGAFELMQRRLADGAVQERWDAGKQVPGVDTFTIISLSLTKV